jgi:EAL domain-containing protein (putative c-di-GMP-specific phosphodiesterase class I)/glycosyltransferase involved in cell wall biosynthesis
MLSTLFSRLKSLFQKQDDRPSLARNINLSIITQFYPPDFAATGQFVEELATYLAEQSMDVQVFTGQPGYAFETAIAPDCEQMGKVWVRRSRLLRLGSRKLLGRTVSSLAFCWHAALHLLKPEHRGDVILFVSEPPYLQTLGYLIKFFFHTPYVCLVYDLYPDVTVALHLFPEHHWIVRLWNWVNRAVWSQAEAIIVPCQTMKARIVAKVPELADKITVIHNWADPTWIQPFTKQENAFAQTHDLVEPFTVLYSGNMGRCHDMDTVINAAWELRQDPVQFVFIGGGPKREECLQRVEALGLTNCKFLPYQDKQLLPQSLTACDLSIVSVDVGMEGLVAPSKFYSALCSGRPVAIICEKHSYLRPLVSDANCGAAFHNGDSQGLAGFIRYLAKDAEMTQRLGQSGHRYIQEYFTLPLIGHQYFKLLQKAVHQNADLYRAIDEQEFQVYYQPIVSLRTECIVGFEALVRWQHPKRGIICPAEFMAAAEETGLIIPIGWWLLMEACRQLRRWQIEFAKPLLKINVNLSSQQFYHPDLIPQLDEVLLRTGLDGTCLTLEIKDSVLMADPAATTAILLQLQMRHIQVCIDDFGTHHSSLAYLHHFPVSTLKIDRSLISRLEMDKDICKLISTVVILARDLGMGSIAEGIETASQLRRLKEIGFEYGQGYHFFKPTDVATTTAILNQQQQRPLLLIGEVPESNSASSETELSSTSTAPLVLVIDDDRSMRTLLKRAIAEAGYRYMEADNGEAGISAYSTFAPDLVLLDAVMPKMDGFTCCTRLHELSMEVSFVCEVSLPANQLPCKPPRSPLVLMITALDDPHSVDRAFAAGAADYITKPINWAVLRQRLRRLLG